MIFGTTKIKTVLRVFKGADYKNEVRFLESNLFFYNCHHVEEQNTTGQNAHQVFIETVKNLLDKYDLGARQH